jgi:hypothetical protein
MANNKETELPKAEVVSAKHKRATPLKPTVWMTGVLVWATTIALFLHVPTWGGIFLCTLTALSFLLYLGSYIFLLATDRETLRTERYAIKGSPSNQRDLQGQSQLEASENNRAIPAGVTTPIPLERRLGHAKVESTELPRGATRIQEQ